MTDSRARASHPVNAFREDTVARTRTLGRRDAATFARSPEQTEPSRRFGRASARPSRGAAGRRRRQPEQSGAQKLIQGIRGVLPGAGGKSSAKPGRRSAGSIPVVGGLLSSLGQKKRRGAGRGRKPAMFGMLGASAAGAAAAVVKRRTGSRSSQAPADRTSGLPEPQTAAPATSTPAHRPDTPAPGETAQPPDTPAGDEAPQPPDPPAAGDQRG
jgi:hypothetical protein